MKLLDLYEDFGNQYYRVEKPITVWALKGHEPSNHYYGASRLHKPVYEEKDLERDDEIHSLHGGVFAVELFNESSNGKVSAIQLTKPKEFSPFEKNYGIYDDPNKSTIEKYLKSGHLVKISVKEKTNTKYVSEGILAEGWHRSAGNKYTTDMSEIDHHQKTAKVKVRCPQCKKPIDVTHDLSPSYDNEGEVQSWDGTHSCGAQLTVFND